MAVTKHRLAIVTGASRGIGAETARRLAAAGYQVALVARTMTALRKVAAGIKSAGGEAFPFACDVSSKRSVDKALAQIESRLGPVSVLINNAGEGGPLHTADKVSDSEWRKLFATNIDSAHFFCSQLLGQMRNLGFGRVVNISSILGLTGNPRSSTYAATKHALVGYTRSLAVEWGAYGITCNCICPGYIDTDMTNKGGLAKCRAEIVSRIPAGRYGKPSEIADLIGYLVRPESAYINGSIIVIDGGMMSGTPS